MSSSEDTIDYPDSPSESANTQQPIEEESFSQYLARKHESSLKITRNKTYPKTQPTLSKKRIPEKEKDPLLLDQADTETNKQI